MSTIVTSIVAAFALAVGAGVVFCKMQKPVYVAEAAPSVRISDPGDNLVGADWSGLYKIPQADTKVSRADLSQGE
jgi:uncharacterized protein involved in exopolysaccharide biosynthesis